MKRSDQSDLPILLEKLSQLYPSISLDVIGANDAAEAGYLDILKWLSSRDPPILPDVIGANNAISGDI